MAHLIDKSALVAEIEKRIQETESMHPKFDQFWAGQISAFKGILKILDTLEVKEVDLEKEYKDFVEEDPVYNKLVNGIVGKAIANHFFELGLSVNNPITAADRGTAEEIILALNTLGEEKMISYDKEIKWLNKLKEL